MVKKERKSANDIKSCLGSSSDTTANKINPYYLIG